jgi:hypothetical protein
VQPQGSVWLLSEAQTSSVCRSIGKKERTKKANHGAPILKRPPARRGGVFFAVFEEVGKIGRLIYSVVLPGEILQCRGGFKSTTQTPTKGLTFKNKVVLSLRFIIPMLGLYRFLKFIQFWINVLRYCVIPTGLEPVTYYLEGSCSIR